MDIKRAKEEIKNTIEAYLLKDSHGEYMIPSMRQRPVLLIGPPGIGKTQIMEQAARECGIGLVSYTITHHTRQSAIGLPFIQKKQYDGIEHEVTEYTMSEIVAAIYDKIEETGLKEGILFIDEINCVSETLAPAMLQFLQYKTFGNHKIPEGWIITAAGNPPEFNKSVREFDFATLDRVKKINVEADFEVFKAYAKSVGIHPAVISYLTAKPQYFCQIETTVDGKIFATPRGWEDLSRFIEVYEKIGKTVDRDVVIQYIQHPRAAKDFANYLELYYKYQARYEVDEILSGVRNEKLVDQAMKAPFDERLAIISLLLSGLETGFRKAAGTEDTLELVFTQLKDLKEKLQEEKEPQEIFSSVLDGFRSDYELKKKADLLSRTEDYHYRDAEKLLNDYFMEVRSQGLRGAEELFDCVREKFGEDRERYEETISDTSSRLEAAFDFMEAAFGDSQELVIFITELNQSPSALRFLEENECERYFTYNKRLLFEDREADIRSRLARLSEI